MLEERFWLQKTRAVAVQTNLPLCTVRDLRGSEILCIIKVGKTDW